MRLGPKWVLLVCLCALVSVRALAQPAAPQVPPREGEAPETKATRPLATTTDTSGLSLRRNVLAIRLEKGFFEVIEMLDFENRGTAAIVSKDGAPTLRFVLPRSSNVRNPRAILVASPAGLDAALLVSAGDEIRTTESIAPGRMFVVLQYRLEDEFGGIRIEKPILYDTPSFIVLPEKDGVQAAAADLAAQPPVTFQSREYDRLTGAVRAGAVVRIDLQAPDSMGGIAVFYVVVAAVAVGGLGLALYLRRRRSAALSTRVEREEMMRAIALLDDRLAAGEISPAEHARERASRFARLKELSA